MNHIRFSILFLSLLVVVANFVFCQATTGDGLNLVIIDTYLIDRDGKSEDVPVNIHIKDGKLHLVTRDTIPVNEIDTRYDAQGGYVLGNLIIGEAATFMIVDEDPRADLSILLDSKSHTIFAIKNGEIVLNNLDRSDKKAEQIKPERIWRAYSPPPVALSISYQNNRKWNLFKTKYVSGVFAGILAVEATNWVYQDDNNELQIGEIESYTTGTVRGARIGVVGTINFKHPWIYTFFIANQSFERGYETGTDDKYTLFDYRLDIPLGKITLSLGKQKEPISMERITSMIYLPQQERSAMADGMLLSRDIGITISGQLLKSRMNWGIGGYNRWFEKGKSFSETATIFTGRITAVPYLSQDESNLFHLGFSGRYSNANEGVRYETTTEIYRGPLSVDTELMAAKGAFSSQWEAAWRLGPVLFASEYMRARVSSSDYGNLGFSGYHITGSWIVTGEMRSYNKINGTFRNIRVARNVSSGGGGAFEITSRWSVIDLNSGAVTGGRMETFSGGASWWPKDNISINMNVRFSNLFRDEITGHNIGFVTRLLFVLD